jgi:acyl carrier protein
MDAVSIKNRLVEFLQGLTGQVGLAADSELIESGIADSLTIMDLMVFIETEFALRLDPADMNAEVFRTPAALADCISARIAPIRDIRAA